MYDGYLLIDKPAGWTSFDVVAKVRSLLTGKIRQDEGERRRIKVGHTGTLDPAATGLLVILVGKYTKKADQLTKLDKTYQVQLTLGRTSSTGDSEGEIVEVNDAKPTEVQISASLKSFVGTIQQVPPAHSAIKINGQRAYKLAREGVEVVMETRTVIVYGISALDYDYPTVSFTCEVSSGTYIRSLARDVGQQLGVGAYMSALRRTKIGDFDISNSMQISKETDAQSLLGSICL